MCIRDSLEHHGGTGDRCALTHGLGHFEVKSDLAINVDQLAVGTQRVEELPKVLERHSAMLHTSCVVVAGKYNEHPVTPGVARVTLRQFALAVHASEDVPAACVSLQDRFGLDVNVLLLAAYIGAVHRQTISAEQVGAARTLVDEWHAEVVRPLRGVRRLLKSGPAPAPNERTEEVRNKVAKAELDAELVELDLLDGWASEQQAMLNVLMNAFEAVAEGGDGRLVEVDAHPTDGHGVLIEVRDSGPGLPVPEARIFEAFYTTKTSGMGMGLPIVRTIVEAHGGSIRAANHPRGGAVLSLELPLSPGEPE